MFSGEIYIPAFFLISLATTEGFCSGLRYFDWSIPLSSILILVIFEPSSEFFFFKLFQLIGYT